jgi:chromosomal replication initiation ATPase DnaA
MTPSAAPAPLPSPNRAARGAASLASRLDLLVAPAFAVPGPELRARTRGGARAALARQTAMYLAHVALGLTFSEIGRRFGRDRTTAAHACRVIEERREDSAFDALVGRLERACAPLRADAAARGDEHA